MADETLQARAVITSWAWQLGALSDRWADLPPREDQSNQALAKRLEAIGDVMALAKSEQLAEVVSIARRRHVLGSGLELGRPSALDALQLTPDDLDAEDLPAGRPPTVRNLVSATELDLGALEQIAAACQDAGMVADGEGA